MLKVNYLAAAEFWGALNCGVTQAHTGGIRGSISELAEITGQSRLAVDKKVYFSFSWNFLQEVGPRFRR
jgi:hypothetical protein